MTPGLEVDPCDKCEEMMQPYLDKVLSDEERAEAEAHLDGCAYCRKRYTFEVELRTFVRTAFVEEMPPELKLKLSDLRTRSLAGRSGRPGHDDDSARVLSAGKRADRAAAEL